MKILTANGFELFHNQEDCEMVYRHPSGFSIGFGELHGDNSKVICHWGDGRTHYIQNEYYTILGFLVHHRLIGFLSYIGVDMPNLINSQLST